MKIISIFLLMLTVCAMAAGQETARDFSEYGEMHQYLVELYNEQKYKEAVTLLENHLTKFPDHLMANSLNLALFCGLLEQYAKGIKAIKYAHEQGIWFSKYAFNGEIWNAYKELDEFSAVYQRNQEMMLDARKSAKSFYEVVTPEGYTDEKKYPLFIALHGGGSNIGEFRGSWHSKTIQNECITLFVQSSQIIAMNGYNWTEDLEITRKEVLDAFEQVCEDYTINKKEIIVGGFSSGGVASMEVVLAKTIPAAGFIALCPGKPDSFTEELLADAKKNKVRCAIFTTEFDQRLEQQKEMVEAIEKAGLENQFIISPNTGHWFPENFDTMLDEAIDFIRAD